MLTIVLVYVGYKTIRKGINIYEQETAGKIKSTFIEYVDREENEGNENTHSYDPLISEVRNIHLIRDKFSYF